MGGKGETGQDTEEVWGGGETDEWGSHINMDPPEGPYKDSCCHPSFYSKKSRSSSS